MNYRDAMYYSVTGEKFSGAEAGAMKFVNKSVPPERLREETMKLANKLADEEPRRRALHQGSGAQRAQHEQGSGARLSELQERCAEVHGSEKGREKAMKQFLDEKSFKPGLGNFSRG